MPQSKQRLIALLIPLKLVYAGPAGFNRRQLGVGLATA